MLGSLSVVNRRSKQMYLTKIERETLLEFAALINNGHMDIVALLAQHFVSRGNSVTRARRNVGLGRLVAAIGR